VRSPASGGQCGVEPEDPKWLRNVSNCFCLCYEVQHYLYCALSAPMILQPGIPFIVTVTPCLAPDIVHLQLETRLAYGLSDAEKRM
jgi:hypothetical protein